MSTYIYADPQDYGLEPVGEVEFSSSSYEFDTVVVWRDVETGRLYYAHDSGCSCPIPFESYNRTNITPITKWPELHAYLMEQFEEHKDCWGWEDREQHVAGQIGELVGKVREIMRRG